MKNENNNAAQRIFPEALIRKANEVSWWERLLLRAKEPKRYAYMDRDVTAVIEYKKMFGKTYIINMHTSMGYGGVRTGGKTAGKMILFLTSIDPELGAAYAQALTETLTETPNLYH